MFLVCDNWNNKQTSRWIFYFELNEMGKDKKCSMHLFEGVSICIFLYSIYKYYLHLFNYIFDIIVILWDSTSVVLSLLKWIKSEYYTCIFFSFFIMHISRRKSGVVFQILASSQSHNSLKSQTRLSLLLFFVKKIEIVGLFY